MMNTIKELQHKLKVRISKGETWAQIAEEYNVNPAVLWRIVNEDYVPKRADLRKKLGLPELMEVEVVRNELGRFAKQ